MKDPRSELEITLQSLFRTAIIRNGKYTIQPIQELKEAVDDYNPSSKSSFYNLVKAVAHCAPYMNKKFHMLKHAVNSLGRMADHFEIPSAQWLKIMKEESRSPQFAAHPHPPSEKPLIPWLSDLTNQQFSSLTHSEKTQTLVEHSSKKGFSPKLNDYLKRNPEFLFTLALESEQNFQKILGCLLNLYLTDTQLAKAILVHMPKLRDGAADQEQFIKKMDKMMSSGRSMQSLLRNSDAQALLEDQINFDDPASPKMRT